MPTSFKISAPVLPWGVEIYSSPYIAAFYLKVSKESPPHEKDAPPPAPGRPPSVGFYKNLLRDYDVLVRQGHRTPVKELAARIGTKEGAVKVWLHRGRRYLA